VYEPLATAGFWNDLRRACCPRYLKNRLDLLLIVAPETEQILNTKMRKYLFEMDTLTIY